MPVSKLVYVRINVPHARMYQLMNVYECIIFFNVKRSLLRNLAKQTDVVQQLSAFMKSRVIRRYIQASRASAMTARRLEGGHVSVV